MIDVLRPIRQDITFFHSRREKEGEKFSWNYSMRVPKIKLTLRMNRPQSDKRLFALAVIVFMLLGAPHILWALFATHNRPNPLMDYVPQEIGIDDTLYWELEEYDCRKCHGNTLADRHHLTDVVVISGLCTPCHEVLPEPPFVVVVRDCLTSGCHSWADVETNGWHHGTDMSASDSCVSCHDPNLIQEITPIRDFTMYPPSVATPTPFSCENCHWGQDHVPGGEPDDPGHPSTYEHYNEWNQFIGFHEYANPIYDNFHTHHMGSKGNVASQCYKCHSLDPNYPDWDAYNPDLIRYCETCHSIETLHSIGPHVQDTNGWEAAGFHVPASNTQTRDVDPTVYRTWNPVGPYAPETPDGFTTDQMCFGCHGDNVPKPPPVDDCTNNMPVIDTTGAGIEPQYGTYGVIVTLRGQNFGAEYISGRNVQIKRRSSCDPWVAMPVYSWTDTLLEFEVPCCEFAPGNYKVRVKTECGKSNAVSFGLKDWISLTYISPEAGPCVQKIRLKGNSFGDVQSKMFADGYTGVHRAADFVSSQGTFTALTYKGWTDEEVKVKFKSFFEDMEPRNYVQDSDEPTIRMCSELALGTWSVYVTGIYFGDDDGSQDLSSGDMVFQLVTSDPVYFELTNDPIVYRLNPEKIERDNLLKIVGHNFGPTQTDGEVRIGSQNQAEDPDLGLGEPQESIKLWSNTKIKVYVDVPQSWEGKTKYLWLEKSGVKSNYKKLKILEPLP